MHRVARVVSRAVQAVRAERVPVQVGLTAASANVLVTCVHLAAVIREFCAVVEDGEDVLAGHGDAHVAAGGQAIGAGDGGHVAGVTVAGPVGEGAHVVSRRGRGQQRVAERDLELNMGTGRWGSGRDAAKVGGWVDKAGSIQG